MTNPPNRPRTAAAICVALGLGVMLVPLHPTDAAARRSSPGQAVNLPPETADEDLPVPPIPPDQPPAYSAAPVPNGEQAPTAAPTPQTGAELNPGVFNQQNYGEGNGYLFGSNMSSENDRRAPPAGFRLNMPLQ